IDLTLAGLQPGLLRVTIKALLISPVYDALTIIVGSMSLAMPDLLANAIADCLPLSDKPVIAYLSPHAPEIGAVLIGRGVPAFSAPESCAVVLAAMLEAQQWRAPEIQVHIEPKIKVEDLARRLTRRIPGKGAVRPLRHTGCPGEDRFQSGASASRSPYAWRSRRAQGFVAQHLTQDRGRRRCDKCDC